MCPLLTGRHDMTSTWRVEEKELPLCFWYGAEALLCTVLTYRITTWGEEEYDEKCHLHAAAAVATHLELKDRIGALHDILWGFRLPQFSRALSESGGGYHSCYGSNNYIRMTYLAFRVCGCI